MRFAILIRGIHYDPKYKIGIDYRKTIDNFKEYVIQDLVSKQHEVDVFLSTYDSKYINKVSEDYNAKNTIVNTFDDYSRHTTISNGLQMIIDTNELYDCVFVYRFDIKLKTKLTDLPSLHYTKLNIPFFSPGLHKGEKRINDAFYVFPFEYLKDVFDIFEFVKFQRQTHNHLYGIFRKKFGKHQVNMLINKAYNSHSDRTDNPLYKNRIK